MPIILKRRHWYKRKDGNIVQYDCPTPGRGPKYFPHRVGGLAYTNEGRYQGGNNPHRLDLVKDLGTTDPRLKKTRKAPAKKFRKVRMWCFERDSFISGKSIYAYDMKCTAIGQRNAMETRCGPIFSQMINVPIPSPKKKV